MPMYEYQCSQCGLVFEALQKFSDAPLTECRSCGAAVEKLVSSTAFALKGGGWYDQGYSSAPAKPGANATKCAAETSNSCGGCCKK